MTTKMICDKFNMPLRICRDNSFILNFSVINEKTDLSKYINLNLYTLVGKLNTDVISDINIHSKVDNQNINFTIKFQQFGKNMGISKKYANVNTQMHITSDINRIEFISNKIKQDVDITKEYEEIEEYSGKLIIDYSDIHSLHCEYVFEMNIGELPIYMRKLPGMLIKKTFIRLKQFLEHLN